MPGFRAATGWDLACGVLGSGLIVFPPLAAAVDARTGAALVAAGCLAVLAAGLLFRYRPFGRSRAGSVSQLPMRWRMIYVAGFLGGASYFASTAIAMLGLAGATPLWAAVGWVLLAVLGFGVAPPVPASVKLAGVLTTVVMLAASPSGTDLLGRRSGGGVPLLTALAAAALLTVGWEAVPSRGARRAEVLVAAMVCCLVIVASYLWVRYQGPAMMPLGGDAGRRPIAIWTATVLAYFLSGNLRAIGAFCAPGVVGMAALRYRLFGCLAVLVLVTVQRELFARGWLLLIPALATIVLYGGYAAGRPPAGRSTETAADAPQSSPPTTASTSTSTSMAGGQPGSAGLGSST